MYIHTCIHTYINMETSYRSWLMRLWRLSRPSILLSASWGTRKDHRIIQSKYEGPGTRGLSKGLRRWLSQYRQRANSLFLCLFVSFRLSGMACVPLYWWRGSSSLRPVPEMLISSRNTPTDTPRNGVLPIWVSPSPVKLTHKIHHKSIPCEAGTRIHFTKPHLISKKRQKGGCCST